MLNERYKEAVEYLLDIPKFVKKTDKDNIIEILKELGNPQDKMKVIHIAGTNGKGSTCAFLNSILMAAGKSVGMFTSPHLVKINERIKVQGEDVSDEDFLWAFECIKNKNLSFFEMLFVLALLVFEKAGVEYAILETGLGGRLDATNVVDKPVVTIITSVSLDHMEILGNTVEEIAVEKAGIIKQNVPLVYCHNDDKVIEIIENKAKSLNASTIRVSDDMIKITEKSHKAIDFCFVNMYDKYGVIKIPFVMEYQVYNCALAILALEQIEGLNITRDSILKGVLDTRWAGRMQEIQENVFLDGAHNEEGLREFVNYVGSLEEDITLMFSVVKEKDYMSMINLLNTLTNVKRVVIAPVQGARALSMDKIIPLIRLHTNDDIESNVEIIDKANVIEAFTYALQAKEKREKLFCVGSLYMVGEIMEYIEKGLKDND